MYVMWLICIITLYVHVVVPLCQHLKCINYQHFCLQVISHYYKM